MGKILMLAGFTIAAGGLLIEAIGVAAITFYPLRRRLMISPFALMSIDGLCFFGGILFGLAARYLIN
jgi:hypothetical protein